ncbi:CG6175 [Drosophila busckii]|uniref:CG6175 n=1 Tax=Drosophila busckii TaxID=30019 RepID=A0A0M4EGT8_DROBS|nr:CG6175 [Drosophila busckii]
MSSSGGGATTTTSTTNTTAQQYKLDANSNAIALIGDAAAPPASPSPADRIEWSRATILGFIEDYRCQRVLWDPNTKGYHIKQTKYEALKLLSQKYGTEIRSIRSKIKSLRSSFHREHGKVLSGRNRGVLYQPMWFAYEAIRFILDGERDADAVHAAAAAAAALDASNVDGELAEAPVVAKSEAVDKLTLMHSLDLEQLTAVSKQQVEQQQQQQQQQQEEKFFAARVAAVVAAAAAAAAAANHNNLDTDAVNSAANTNGCGGGGGGGGGGGCGNGGISDDADDDATAASVHTSGVVSAALTRSSSDLDGENYCSISAEDVKTEIIEHETELSMLDRQTSTPLSLSYYKPTDLTYNNRKRKAPLDENDVSDMANGVGVGIVGGVVGALTLTPIKSTTQLQVQTHGNSSMSLKPNNNLSANHVDEYGVFGEYVAITIRKLKTAKSKIVVKHLINNLLYEAELGKYDQGMPASKEPPQLYKMQ